MAYLQDGYISDRPAAYAIPSERATFIQRTYAHLAGAILAFAGLEYVLLSTGLGKEIIGTLFAGKFGILLLIGLMIGGGFLARYWAFSQTSPTMQYVGLGAYVVLEALIFLPILYIADAYYAGQYLIPKAGIMTLGVFGGLTTTVFVTKRDFSFLGPIICVASWCVLGLIVCSIIFGFNLGTLFSFAMVGLASAYILYDTSNVLHRYRTDQYVGASLELFASIATLFYYILRILMSNSNRN